jgi:hypothetical protein
MQLGELAKNVEYLLVLRLLANVVNVDVANFSFLIDYDDGALAVPSCFTPDTILLRDFTLRMEVCEKRITLDASEGFCVGYVTGNAVDRNAQDLGIIPFEVGGFRLVRRHLNRSHRGPVEWIKDENYVFLSAKITEANFLATSMTRQLEVGSHVSDLERGCLGGDGSSS